MIGVYAKVPCPQCIADEDAPCQSADGEPLPDGAIHPARQEAAAARLVEVRRGGAKLYEWSVPPDYAHCLYIAGEECVIWLEARPGWCDRGRVRATVDCWGKLGASFDHQDGWPRYYFNVVFAKLEIEAWIRFRERSLRNTTFGGQTHDMVKCTGEGCAIDVIPEAAAWVVNVIEPMNRARHLGVFCTSCYMKLNLNGLTFVVKPVDDPVDENSAATASEHSHDREHEPEDAKRER
jgi:hypothetical protein